MIEHEKAIEAATNDLANRRGYDPFNARMVAREAIAAYLAARNGAVVPRELDDEIYERIVAITGIPEDVLRIAKAALVGMCDRREKGEG